MVLGEHATDEAVNQLREQLHLNDSLGQQFLIFLQNVFLHADTGNSIKYGVSCHSLILQYAPVTLLLVVMSMTISIVISLLLSFTAATHKDGIADHLIRIIPIIAHGMPVFLDRTNFDSYFFCQFEVVSSWRSEKRDSRHDL